MTFREVRQTQPLLAIISDKKFDWHRLEHAQMVCAPATDTDEKNPFHLSFSLSSETREPSNYDRAFSRAINVSAIVAGVSAIAIPAALSASIFPAAVPFPPEMIAPACPILRPGGAVPPAMNAATGFLQLFLIHSAASSSAEPPISPIRIIASVCRSSLKSLTASRCEMPWIGSPPIPIQVDWP